MEEEGKIRERLQRSSVVGVIKKAYIGMKHGSVLWKKMQ